jgi:Flp pilus assembly protein TadD
LRAVAEIDRKQFGQADDDLKKALEKAPDSADIYVQLGNLRMAQKQQGEAQKAYQKALDVDPNNANALGGVLNVYQAQNQFDKALAAANAQIAKNPNNSSFHMILGALLQAKKDLAGAESEYKKAVDLDKNNLEALANLGNVQTANGKTDAALQTFLDAAKNHPREAQFYLLAGSVYEEKKDWADARQMYQKVLEIRPDDPVASNNLAYVMLQQGGNVDVALAMAQTARRQMPDNPNAADTLGWAYYQKGVYTSATDLFKEASKKDPDSAAFAAHLGMAYAKTGQLALARQQLDRAKKIDPSSPEAQELGRNLQRD